MYNLSMNIKRKVLDLHQQCMGHPPSYTERSIVTDIGRKMTAPHSIAELEDILKAIHRASGIQAPYSSRGRFWKSLGFQNEDPISDIRGGGALCLENMLYFLTKHPLKSRSMREHRSLSSVANYRWESFPWAAAGINVTQLVAVQFEAIDSTGQQKSTNYSRKTYWSFIRPNDGFNRVYILAFLLLDTLWNEMNASYMQFPDVLAGVKDELANLLAISSSLSDMEQRVYRRVDYFPNENYNDYDYTTLPSAPIGANNEFEPHDVEECNISFTKAPSSTYFPSVSAHIVDRICEPSYFDTSYQDSVLRKRTSYAMTLV